MRQGEEGLGKGEGRESQREGYSPYVTSVGAENPSNWMVLYNAQVSMSIFTLATFGYSISGYWSVQGVFVEARWKGERGTNGGKFRLEGEGGIG